MNKQFINASILGCIICSPALQGSVTIEYQGVGGTDSRNVILSSGAPVPNGNEVRIGYFDTTFNPSANRDNLVALGNAWHSFDTTSIFTYTDPDPDVAGSFYDSETRTDSAFDNKQVYLWVFKTTLDNAPASDYSNVQQHGLFTASGTDWIFPPSDSNPMTGTIYPNAKQVTSFIVGNLSLDNNSLQLANYSAVPEPTGVGIAFALGSGIWAILRRRNQ
jgi:hypothetical protein